MLSRPLLPLIAAIKLFCLPGCGVPHHEQALHKNPPCRILAQQNEQSLAINNIYGSFIITEPILIELIANQWMQRLKKIHQLGHSAYMPPYTAYNRFDHSIGVFSLVRRFGGALSEQIAALIHDISHTALSHSTGHLFFPNDPKAADAWQDDNHERFLHTCGIVDVLKKYHVDLKAIDHQNKSYTRLEQPLPDICADRLDYNLQEALARGMMTMKEVQELLSDLHFEDNKWFFTTKKSAQKLGNISLTLTIDSWGAHEAQVSARWFCTALRHALEKKYITKDMILYGADDEIWQRLNASNDVDIARCMQKIAEPARWYTLDEKNPDEIIRFKPRGIDSLIKTDNGSFTRLSSIDNTFFKKYNDVQARAQRGWPIKYTQHD